LFLVGFTPDVGTGVCRQAGVTSTQHADRTGIKRITNTRNEQSDAASNKSESVAIAIPNTEASRPHRSNVG
jgi:hypothetical protein